MNEIDKWMSMKCLETGALMAINLRYVVGVSDLGDRIQVVMADDSSITSDTFDFDGFWNQLGGGLD